jgi:16S rRNA (guanine527-N7)-methyltransferase
MEEVAARAWLDVPRETLDRLDAFATALRAEAARQNLVSRASLDHIWSRHVVDSAQLLRFAPANAGNWLDLGTGAGFPGLIVALLCGARVTIVESRKLRAEWLVRASHVLGVEEKVEIICARVETVTPRPFDVISARAFAPLDRLLDAGVRFSEPDTIWILPKGRNAKSELEGVRASWQGAFRVEPSLTDDDAGIVVGRGVSRRAKGKR